MRWRLERHREGLRWVVCILARLFRSKGTGIQEMETGEGELELGGLDWKENSGGKGGKGGDQEYRK